jgi:hypothetical protein
MESEIQSYPIVVFYIIAFLGLVLIFLRPRYAFFFSVFCFSIRNFQMAIFTRGPYLGEFLNLNDLLMWISLLAMLRIAWQGQRLWIPNIALTIISIIVLGGFQALIQYGFHYLVMRDIWASCVFPLMFIVGTNMIRNKVDARFLYWTIFWGSCGAALQHILSMQSSLLSNELIFGLAGFRNVEFMYSGGIFLVVAAIFIDMRKIMKNLPLFLFWSMGISLIGISYVLSFTRTIWAGAVLAGFSIFILLIKEHKQILSRLGHALPLIVMAIIVFRLTISIFIPEAEVTTLIDERADFVRYEDSFEEAYESREAGMETELKLWLDGPIIWGIGTSYPPVLHESVLESYEATGAIGHVAFSAYLVHYGLIGLITYAILLPFLAIRTGRRYYFLNKHDYGGVIALTSIALAFFDVFTLGSGHHYLIPKWHVQGIIYGALWGLSRSLEVSPVRTLAGRTLIHKLPHQWFPGTVSR